VPTGSEGVPQVVRAAALDAGGNEGAPEGPRRHDWYAPSDHGCSSCPRNTRASSAGRPDAMRHSARSSRNGGKKRTVRCCRVLVRSPRRARSPAPRAASTAALRTSAAPTPLPAEGQRRRGRTRGSRPAAGSRSRPRAGRRASALPSPGRAGRPPADAGAAAAAPGGPGSPGCAAPRPYVAGWRRAGHGHGGRRHGRRRPCRRSACQRAINSGRRSRSAT
jgi:hypothetical protein